MVVFDGPATVAALPFETLIEALAKLFKAGCVMPERQVLEIPSRQGGLTSLIMPAWVEGRCYGVKTVNIAPGNSAAGLPGLHSSYSLFDAVTGEPIALIDGTELTARRTAASSALAASYLARADATHLLIVGSGRIASILADAYLKVRRIEQVTVWARDPAKADCLVRNLEAAGFRAEIATDLKAAVGAADIISSATLATRPLIEGAWLQPGSHLDLIGSFTPAMQEADPACFSGSELYLDSAAALAKSGDLIEAIKAGVVVPAQVRGTLESLVRGDAKPRTSARERTVFKSVGIALEDLAAAMLVARR
jgi:ornithine cyclodeaminase